MNESTARAVYELQSSPSPSYVWSVTEKPVTVRIPFPVIDRLEQQAVESFRSLTSKGSEIGGLLYGRVAPGEPCELSIDDYELITCDYSRGPLYRLSDADMGRFDRSITQLGNASLRMVVGFFRSNTRKGLTLDGEDLAFFDSRFREPHHIVLLVRPFATKASTAGIFIREAGNVRGEASYLEFPFRSSLLSAGKPVEEVFENRPVSGLGGALPAPSVPKTSVRGQIVPIASRREIAATIPSLAIETTLSRSTVETDAEPEAAAAAPEAVAPVEEPIALPKQEERDAVPTTEAKAASPKPEEQPAPKVEEEPARPRVEEKAAAFKAEAAVASAVSTIADSQEETGEPVRSRKNLWIGLGVAVPVLLLLGFFALPTHKNQPSTPSQDNSALSLRVERTAGEILLTWNRDSDAIRSATHAVLSIADGDQHENVEMDLAQLRNGSISYSPATSDVVFKMEVTGKGQEKTASESVRVLRTRPSPLAGPESVVQPAVQTPAAPAVKPPDANVPNAANAAANGNPAANANPANGIPGAPNGIPGAPNGANGQPDATKPPEPRPLKPFQAPTLSQRLHPASNADLPEAPVLGRLDSGAPAAVAGLNMNTAAAPVAPPTANPSPSAPVEKKLVTGGQIQPAVLISRRPPEYPRLARQTGAKGVVQLIATIGTDGQVKSVKVVKGPPMLQKAAADAVMQWRYRPTMLNGNPVEAETEVLVNFMGNER